MFAQPGVEKAVKSLSASWPGAVWLRGWKPGDARAAGRNLTRRELPGYSQAMALGAVPS